jgi:hypothetical protein
MDPVPDQLLFRKAGSAGNRTWTSESIARNSDHYTTEAVSSQPREDNRRYLKEIAAPV